MSSTNKTSNLELSQFIGTDSPKWLTDYNSDMQKIDAGVAAVQTQANATDLVVSGHTSSIQANTQSITDQQTAITSLRADVTAAQGSINTINSLIGNGEPTTTDKTIIGAINELAAEMPSPTTQLPATSITYSNTDSGLSATNVQAAIDELKADVPDVGVVIASVTADGVKTVSQLLDSLYALISGLTFNELANTTLNMGTVSHSFMTGQASTIQYGSFYVSEASDIIHVETVNMRASGSKYPNATIGTSGTTFDRTAGSVVPASGTVYSIERL